MSSHAIDKPYKNTKQRNGLFFNDFWHVALSASQEIQYGMQELAEQNKDCFILKNTSKISNIENINIGYALMTEVFQLSFKALVCGRSLMRDLKSGQHTHACITAYQGSMYWCKAFLGLCGIWTNPKKIENAYWLIDLYPTSEKKISTNYTIISIGSQQIGHVEIWLLIKRLLRTTKNPLWDSSFGSFLENIEASDIGYIRHHIQYYNDFWLYEDLKKDCLNINDISWIGSFNENVYFTLDVKEDSPTKSMVFFYLLFLRNFFKFLDSLSPSLVGQFSSSIEEIRNLILEEEIFAQWIDSSSKNP